MGKLVYIRKDPIYQSKLDNRNYHGLFFLDEQEPTRVAPAYIKHNGKSDDGLYVRCKMIGFGKHGYANPIPVYFAYARCCEDWWNYVDKERIDALLKYDILTVQNIVEYKLGTSSKKI